MTSATPCYAGHDWPDVGNGNVPCCMGSAVNGPSGCTCWEPIYTLEQNGPRLAAPGLRSAPCDDCAYRGGSPERRGDEHVQGDADELVRLAATNQPFFCHQGLRQPRAYRHPSGATFIPPHLEVAYDPPIRNGVPYRADGTPADLCAGWAAVRLRQGNDGDQIEAVT